MKSAAEKYFSSIKKILPGWNGADIGHTAARDWYVGLVLATMLGTSLVIFGALRFFDASQVVNTKPENLPTRSFPTDETKILETKNLFDARAVEFEGFSGQVPTAPDPGREKETEEVVEDASQDMPDATE